MGRLRAEATAARAVAHAGRTRRRTRERATTLVLSKMNHWWSPSCNPFNMFEGASTRVAAPGGYPWPEKGIGS
ncbi:MAG: hypothetical protein JRN59_08920 [Nitrososphaerota archaeon]|nr:hypothetical protein [Nitrososphaerota archaeon]